MFWAALIAPVAVDRIERRRDGAGWAAGALVLAGHGGPGDRRMSDRRALLAGLGVVVASFVVFWLSDRGFDAGRPDFFYLADAFLHGRVWLTTPLGPADVVIVGDRTYVPFAPVPGLRPDAAGRPRRTADRGGRGRPGSTRRWRRSTWASCWWLVSRLGVRSLVDRLFLAILFGFSTQIWWVTTRGGVWHTGHLVAALLTLAILIELEGRRRPWLIGLLAGAAFLTRAPLAFAIPFYALFLVGGLPRRDGSWFVPLARRWIGLAIGVLPSLVVFFGYNAARFGSPLESGYGLAALPAWLEAIRAKGLFSTAHLSMNLDYLFVHLPQRIDTFPCFRPDGLGMSVLITSPGLFWAVLADWRRWRSWLLLGAAVATLVPSLLYYGGGWLQYGYRYALDSIPFVIALCGIAAARRGVGLVWRIAIVWGVIVGLGGVYWAYNLH